MLAEGIVREENAVLRAPGDHVVRPVHHGGLREVERALADADGVTSLHAVDLDAVMRANLVHTGGRARHDAGIRREAVDCRPATGMVHLHVVRHDKLDLRGIDNLRDALNELVGERRLRRIDERHGLVQDEIGVVGDTALGGVTVELALVPVEAADPPNLRRDLNRVEHVYPFSCLGAARPDARRRVLP